MTQLDDQLASVSLVGDIASGKSLLDAGADINSRNSIGCTPLMHAANKGQLAYVRMLLERGAQHDLKSDNGNTAYDWAKGKAKEEIQQLLTVWSAKSSQQFIAQEKNQVICISEISNRTLEEIFNFSSRERISLIRRSPGGPVEAITREDFSDIKNQDILHKVFEKYRALGGKISEDDVFPDSILKARMPRLNIPRN
jgi:hypothetical protein